jgi:hypothetical protein
MTCTAAGKRGFLFCFFFFLFYSNFNNWNPFYDVLPLDKLEIKFPFFYYFSVLLVRAVISSLRRQTRTIVYFFFRLAGQEEVDRTSAGDMKKNGWMLMMAGGWPWTFLLPLGTWAESRRLAHSDFYWLFFFLNQHGILR